jgi:hypothetical protein
MAETDFSGDTVAIFPDFGMKWWLGEGGKDEWGSIWEIVQGHKDMGQVKNRAIDNLKNFPSIRIPDAFSNKRYSHWDEILKRAEKEDKYVVCCNGPYLFERAHFLYGFENTLIAIMEEPDELQAFLRHISKYHFNTIRYISENFNGRIHGYRGTDDWGTQNATFISPEKFRQIFLPVYKEIFGFAHNSGLDVWMHSCGQIYDIIPLLIEAGVDVINLMQPEIFPVERLSEFRGKICFEICPDIQTILPKGNKNEIEDEIKKILNFCCADSGGLIEMKLDRMICEGNNIDPEIGEFCHNVFQKFDPFIKMKSKIFRK